MENGLPVFFVLSELSPFLALCPFYTLFELEPWYSILIGAEE